MEASRDSATEQITVEKPNSMGLLLPFQETVFLICLGYSRDYTEAEDLAQDAYLKACRSLAGLREPSRAKEWLCRIAKNICLDHQKKTRVRGLLLRRWARESLSEPASRGSEETPDSRIERLKSAARRLPKKQRDVFVLREYGHLTYEELSATLRINRGTVMSRLNRARRKVAAALQEKSYG
jgi:RNA polymerase sigma-70 factor (ECF subfamily)